MAPQVVHEILVHDFSNRYLERTGFAKVAYSAPYDPDDSLSDYDRTWWPARPRHWSVAVAELALPKLVGIKQGELKPLFLEPFARRAAELTAAVTETPVMVVAAHKPDLAVGGGVYGYAKAVADHGDYASRNRRRRDMFANSHVIATRGLAPVALGRPWLPGRPTLVGVAQHGLNLHTTFPINDQMRASGLSEAFRKDYNHRARHAVIDIARSPSTHPAGYFPLVGMAPNGTPDIPGRDEHAGKMLMKRIEPATSHWAQAMGCAILPLYVMLSKKHGTPVTELGTLVPADEVTEQTLPTLSVNMAEFRRTHGETHVWAEEELMAA